MMSTAGKPKLTLETVRKIGIEMEGVKEGPKDGPLALRAKGKLLAWVPLNKKDVEANTLAVSIDLDQREGMLEDAPDTFYVTGHYRGYPAVLVRLDRIDATALRDLLNSASRFVTSKVRRK
jgi:hypothetical protein